MSDTRLHKLFEPIKRFTPSWLWRSLRRVGTAVLTPYFFSTRTGHLRSSFAEKAVDGRGAPIPWYTYPCIDFLSTRSFEGRKVLEFGGGQSTLWWADRAAEVVTFEGDANWLNTLAPQIPENVALHLAPMSSPEACVKGIESLLSELTGSFDVIVIDGLHRYELIDVATRMKSPSGVIICDNAEGYGFYEGFLERGLARVDFYGYTPGVSMPHSTSLYFGDGCFIFDARAPIPTPPRK